MRHRLSLNFLFLLLENLSCVNRVFVCGYRERIFSRLKPVDDDGLRELYVLYTHRSTKSARARDRLMLQKLLDAPAWISGTELYAVANYRLSAEKNPRA